MQNFQKSGYNKNLVIQNFDSTKLGYSEKSDVINLNKLHVKMPKFAMNLQLGTIVTW